MNRSKFKGRKFEQQSEENKQEHVDICVQTGEVKISPRMSIAVSQLVGGAYDEVDIHISGDQILKLTGLVAVSEASEIIGTVLSVNDFDRIAELGTAVLEGYNQREGVICRGKGWMSTTAAAVLFFCEIRATIPESSLQIARERAAEGANARNEHGVAPNSLLDEYTIASIHPNLESDISPT